VVVSEEANVVVSVKESFPLKAAVRMVDWHQSGGIQVSAGPKFE